MTESRAELLAEAYKRNILPDDMKSAYEEAMRRGLVDAGEAKPVDMAREVGAVGSAGVRGSASFLGAPVDLVNSAIALAQSDGTNGRAPLIPGLGPLARLLPAPSAAPVGGSEWWKDRAGNVVDVGNAAIGNGPTIAGIVRKEAGGGGESTAGRDIVGRKAETRLGRLGSRVVEEVMANALPMMGAMRLGAGAVRAGAPSTRGAVLDAVGGTGTGDRIAQTVASAGAGLGAGVAQEAAPGSPFAEFAGGLLGGGLTGGGMYAAGSLRNLVAPVVSEGARRDIAGQTLRHFATDPTSVMGAPSEIVPGSPLTTAQAAMDPGLAGLERTLRSQTEPGPLFAVRDAERAQGQRAAVQGLAPEGGGAEDVAGMVRGRVEQFQQGAGARVGAAQERVGQQVQALGPGADAVTAGGTIRGELAGARTAAKTAESRQWNRLKENQDLALEVPATKEAALRMRAEITEDTGAPAPFVQAILDRAADWPEIHRYANVSEFRKRLTNAQSALRQSSDATAPTDLRRVTEVLSGLDDDIARAAGGAEAAGAGPAPSPSPRTGGGAPGLAEFANGRPGPQNTGAVFTPGGMRVDTEWRLVDLASRDAPVVSHTPDFRPNPAYPADLQPRDRGRTASARQVTEIAGKLNPERLGSGGVGDGAPIVGPDGVTESGNGRLMAIDRAYRNGGRPAAEYRSWVEGQGFDTAGMQKPALVRVRTNELSPADRVRFAEEANTGPGLRQSAVEQAAQDAGRIGDDALSLYRGGALDDPANTDFARAFVGSMPGGDANALATRGGTLSTEGLRRMQSAMLAKVFGGETPLVNTLLETDDDTIRSLGRALTDAAPALAQLKAAIARGDVPGDFDPTAPLLDAARVAQRARTGGVPIGDVLAQRDAFNPLHPMAEQFLRAAYGDDLSRISRGRAGEALRTYTADAMRQTGGDLFGQGPTAGDVWAAARRRVAGDRPDEPGPSAEDAGPGGAHPSPPAAALSPAGGGSGGGRIVDDGLTPNFGPEEAAQYKAARAATAARAQTFDRGAVGQALKQGGFNARDGIFAMPVEQVAARFFNAGRASATDMAEFLRAAESRPAAAQSLTDYAVGDLRRAAVDAGGRVDPRRWGAWVAKHTDALKPFPEVRAQFSTVEKAQRMADRLQTTRDDAVKRFEKSAAGKFLDRDAEAAFSSVIKAGDKTSGLKQLVRMAKGDETKLGQLRRAAVDHMLRTVENTGSVDALGNQSLSPAKTVGFMRDNAKPLQKSGLLSPGQSAVLRKVEEDMRRAVYVQTVGKAVGSPTYQNMASGAVLGQLTMGFAGRQGPTMGFLSNTIGRFGNWMYRIPDRQVQQLVADAMLDPGMARELMARATPERMQWLLEALRRRAAATGLTTAVTSDGEP